MYNLFIMECSAMMSGILTSVLLGDTGITCSQALAKARLGQGAFVSTAGLAFIRHFLFSVSGSHNQSNHNVSNDSLD